MALLEEKTIIDAVTILDDGTMEIRRADLVLKDGAVISKNYHRHVVTPDQEVTEENERVKKIAQALWTTDVIKAHKDKKEAEKLKRQ